MYVKRGFPDGLQRKSNGVDFIVVDNSYTNKSKPCLFEGNKEETIIEPQEGRTIYVKGINIIGQGNQGKVYVKRTDPEEGETDKILVCYFAQGTRSSTTGAANIKLKENEKIKIETVDRDSSSETFVGISYIEVKE